MNAGRWPLAQVFTIARGSKTEAAVVHVSLKHGEHHGHGECVPYARYGETLENVTEAIEQHRGVLENGLSRESLQTLMPAGAARNAVDCALLDLECKMLNTPAHKLLGTPEPKSVITAYTLSLDTPENMAKSASEAAHRPLLKLKLGQPGDPERLAAIREAAPQSRLIIDANEGWNENNLAENLSACLTVGVELIEQPLPAKDDEALRGFASPIPLCADESVFDRKSLDALMGKYNAINIKLDKTGGITEALALAQEAKQRGLTIMVGCMVGTSLAMAPGMLLTPYAQFVDLDAPLLLAKDRPNGLLYDGSLVSPSQPALWG